MNWVYPESLHVGTAVWMAQREGRLARDDGPGERDDLGPEARKRLGYLRVASLLGRLRVSLAAARGDGGRPDLAVVLLGPMLWSRYAVGGDDVRLAVHADGPAAGDVVVVTEASVVEALVTARLAARDAVRLGLVRLYGSPADAGAALDWLAAIR